MSNKKAKQARPDRLKILKENQQQCQQFRDDLRRARLYALDDGEGYQEIIHAIERLGNHITNESKATGLSWYREKLSELIKDTPNESLFNDVFEVFCAARNDAAHQGAQARHLTSNAVALSLLFEEALLQFIDMEQNHTVEAVMIRDVICAEMWHTVSHIRYQLLRNSFSALPMFDKQKNCWLFISDHHVAAFLSKAKTKSERRDYYLFELYDALKKHGLGSESAKSISSNTKWRVALELMQGRPALVIDDHKLKGIVTPFDLL